MSRDKRTDPVRRARTVKRARVGAGPLRELKDLLYEVYLAAGTPTLDEITEGIGADNGLPGAPSRDTVRRVLNSPEVPGNQADAIAVAVVLARCAAWDERDLAARVHALWVRAHMVQPPGRPIREFVDDPFVLEVHRAIGVGGAAAEADLPPELPMLPDYVEREHDARLSAMVAEVAAGASRLAVLVGGSSTGKTRACWEAVQRLPEGWRLWHPIEPGWPEALLNSLDEVAPRTVIWLNETQHYLLTPAGPQGETVAARLRALLRDPDRAPVLVLGTCWPDYWAALTSGPVDGQPDPHAQARVLLEGNGVPVPDTFSEPALDLLRSKAASDPRLARAVDEADQGQIAQFLAGVPALLNRWRTAPAAARAVIEAAIDARRLGHGRALPDSLLEHLAPHYLTDQQWEALPETWLAQALDYTGAPCRGVRGPLSRVRPRPGEPRPGQPSYVLADFIEQQGRADRRAHPVPAAVWHALLSHASPPHLTDLAWSAQTRGYKRLAFRGYLAAAGGGDTRAMLSVAELLKAAGRSDEAIGWLRYAAESGEADAEPRTINALQDAGCGAEAIDWLQQRAAAGSDDASLRLATLLKAAGRGEELIPGYLRAAEDGSTSTAMRVARLLEEAGRTEEAIGWFRRCGDKGAWSVGNLLRRTGITEEAIEWLRARAEEGGGSSLATAAELLREAGRAEEALQWLRTRFGAGHNGAFHAAVRLLQDIGRPGEALDWHRCAAQHASGQGPLKGGAFFIVHRSAHALFEAGCVDEATAWYRRVALGAAEDGNLYYLTKALRRLQGGDRTEALMLGYRRTSEREFLPFAVDVLAGKMLEAGCVEEALGCHRSAVEHGWHHSLLPMAELLLRLGRAEEVTACYARAYEDDVAEALPRLAELVITAGETERALDALRARADADGLDAYWAAADLLRRAGRTKEALAWHRRAAGTGDMEARCRLAHFLHETGRTDEAIAQLGSWAEAGDTFGLWHAAYLARKSGHTDEAIVWYRRAAEADDDTESLLQAAYLLQQTGRVDEALVCFQRAAEAGDAEALWEAADLLPRAGADTLAWLRARAESGNVEAQLQMALLCRQGHRVPEALSWYRRAEGAGSTVALFMAAQLLREAGHSDTEALSCYRRAAEAGDNESLRHGAELQLSAGCTDEALAWYQRATEAGDDTAVQQAAQLLKDAEQAQEAESLIRYGWEPAGGIAAPWDAPLPQTSSTVQRSVNTYWTR
ncbi:tetratricopeptide repeat protein [Streptomyces inhibens]|uniref:tetratricopeptide repeat protein n=1 Tax=Streptomyces inhibens TaxID=2293571 RepID=UPI001EE6C7C6|nr:hypothetical protein [Streptomyces inhibens]UKY47887.1 hypothetical protein KI385_02985 [Streptomyces inhibens]